MKFHVTWKKRDLKIQELSFYDKMGDKNVRQSVILERCNRSARKNFLSCMARWPPWRDVIELRTMYFALLRNVMTAEQWPVFNSGIM
jgi:hypothetical protein